MGIGAFAYHADARSGRSFPLWHARQERPEHVNDRYRQMLPSRHAIAITQRFRN
jgi:hypothetical protein